MSTPSQPSSQYYDDAFYQDQMSGSYQSAKKYLAHLCRYLTPSSVVDLGCGRGMWLKACIEQGITNAVGLDGPWNSAANMAHAGIQFIPIDFNSQPAALDTRFDLAMSLEVAEHLDPASGPAFVERLTLLSDVVMFGAAYIAQGGTRHVNERPASDWAKLFATRGYDVYDLFRPVLWGDEEIEFWYRQNTFLYVKRGSDVQARLASMSLAPMSNVAFCDCVHPVLYAYKLEPLSAPVLAKKLLKRIGGIGR